MGHSGTKTFQRHKKDTVLSHDKSKHDKSSISTFQKYFSRENIKEKNKRYQGKTSKAFFHPSEERCIGNPLL